MGERQKEKERKRGGEERGKEKRNERTRFFQAMKRTIGPVVSGVARSTARKDISKRRLILVSRIFVKGRYEVEMENQSNLSPSPRIEINRKSIKALCMLSDRVDRSNRYTDIRFIN